MQGGGVVRIGNELGGGRFLIVCEHASNHFPRNWGNLGLDPAARSAHIAWDPGAFGLAEGLGARLDSPVITAGVSRLIYDCNRPPDAPGAMPERSEVYDIPGNHALPVDMRVRRTEAVYLPFHAAVSGQVARMLARGERPAIVTVHSFTPIWFGAAREVEFGVIHDQDPGLALAVAAAARRLTRLRVEVNQPYSAADGVTHTLKLHATPHGLPHVMLEIRNDLIAGPSAETAMADTLAGVLNEALDALVVERKGVA